MCRAGETWHAYIYASSEDQQANAVKLHELEGNTKRKLLPMIDQLTCGEGYFVASHCKSSDGKMAQLCRGEAAWSLLSCPRTTSLGRCLSLLFTAALLFSAVICQLGKRSEHSTASQNQCSSDKSPTRLPYDTINHGGRMRGPQRGCLSFSTTICLSFLPSLHSHFILRVCLAKVVQDNIAAHSPTCTQWLADRLVCCVPCRTIL